jgi:hypothetical protein
MGNSANTFQQRRGRVYTRTVDKSRLTRKPDKWVQTQVTGNQTFQKVVSVGKGRADYLTLLFTGEAF